MRAALAAAVMGAAVVASGAGAAAGPPASEWPHPGGDLGNSRAAVGSTIDAGNVAGLTRGVGGAVARVAHHRGGRRGRHDLHAGQPLHHHRDRPRDRRGAVAVGVGRLHHRPARGERRRRCGVRDHPDRCDGARAVERAGALEDGAHRHADRGRRRATAVRRRQGVDRDRPGERAQAVPGWRPRRALRTRREDRRHRLVVRHGRVRRPVGQRVGELRWWRVVSARGRSQGRASCTGASPTRRPSRAPPSSRTVRAVPGATSTPTRPSPSA